MIDQIAIGLLGTTAVFLSQARDQHQRKFACLFGMASQPFWFYATWNNHQYGIFFLCCLYTIAWGRGIYNNWLVK